MGQEVARELVVALVAIWGRRGGGEVGVAEWWLR